MKLAAVILIALSIGVLLTLGIGIFLQFIYTTAFASSVAEKGGYKIIVTVVTPLIFYFLSSRKFVQNWLK